MPPPPLFLRALSLLLLTAPLSFAHPEPNSLALLDIHDTRVQMTLHIPLTELELSFGHAVSINPQTNLPRWQPDFEKYLLAHLRVRTLAQKPWAIQLNGVQLQRTERFQAGPVDELLVTLSLLPPSGASPRQFELDYDAILHQVVTHKLLVSVHSDWQSGVNSAEPTEVGVIKVDPATSQISPLHVDLGHGDWWSGFAGMIALGIRHIQEGPDHILFLCALLLPATLLVQGRRWGAYTGTHNCLFRLLKLVTAFTAGHSATLLAGALGWVHLPQQPIEVLIAFSILVSSIHAIRPLFPGHEVYAAGGFGLIHGLAFATALADLHLEPLPMALSILGFNLGIELMQLFVIAVTIPWLIVLSLSPTYSFVRNTAALFAATAAAGWMLNRITGQPNFIERSLAPAMSFAPLAVFTLALLAALSYGYVCLTAKSLLAPSERES